ncbi:hypothetical protein DENSPDRAFT_534413 [Dentipellis sp. KUC8613]|nr:hypothetical protein DENSPDRAFT_534413 [Dentipellis sp. KUC8613]
MKPPPECRLHKRWPRRGHKSSHSPGCILRTPAQFLRFRLPAALPPSSSLPPCPRLSLALFSFSAVSASPSLIHCCPACPVSLSRG